MTPEQFVAIIVASTALIAAITAMLVQLRRTHDLVNSKMTELLELTRRSARAEGVLEARELMGRRASDAPSDPH